MTSTTLREMLVKQEPRSYSNCYVCSGPRAECAVYSKPFRDNPFFPFLEHHQIPEGAENIRSDGRSLTCLLCYSFLHQQWDAYEKSNVPYNKRIYWLKRLDGGPFAGMDVNLQPDYESLFESSNAAIDTECRPRTKSSRSHQQSEMDVSRPKLSEHADPLHFGFSNHAREKQESSGTNILDLSMPARTPTSSVSPDVECEVCFTCGEETKRVLSIHVIPSHFVHFPSLASRPKPSKARPIDSEGKVQVCSQCHRSLLQQFECFQKQNVPSHERTYEIGAEVKSEPKEKSFVCYTCGMVSQLSVQRFIGAYPERDGEPYYSFLLKLTPHAGARKLFNGKAAVCSLCYKSFFRQFQVYEVSKTPEEKRKYRTVNESVSSGSSVLRQHLETAVEQLKVECYLCETVTDTLSSINSLPSGDMYFPFVKDLSKPPNAIPIDNSGQVKVCNQCHTSLTYQWNAFENAFIPINQRQYKIPVSKSKTVEKPHSKRITENEHKMSARRAPNDLCSLCENSLTLETACFLETLPRENCMHFPTIRALVKPGQFSYADQYGRILACSQCFLILKNQYEVFESAHVPHAQRQYEIFSSKSEHDRGSHFANDVNLLEAGALHIQVSSPDLKVDLLKHSINAETLLTTVNTLPVSTFTVSSSTISTSANSPQPNDSKLTSSKSNVEDNMHRICGPLDVPYVRPLVLVVPISCYVCGEHNSTGLMYPIRSQQHSDDAPFFPFLTKHALPDGAEKLSKDGSALCCMFCYHSLVSQWLAYETSTYPEDGNRWHRRYNTHNYVCYICGITTYRKRACSISVKDFPFLLEHIRPAGALTLLNGECVVTCQTCFESITSQWKDFERMKVPVEMRKYNWIVLPAPLDDENSRGCSILQENSGSAEGFPSSEGNKIQVDDTGIPHGLKPSHLSVPVPYGVAKPGGPLPGGAHPNAAFPPFSNNLNSALNATRTSSFAAALRKLAKQAVDPITEKDLSPISPASSPASSGQPPNHGRHHAALPMYLNNHNSNQPGRGSPSSVVQSIQGSQGKALDLGRYSAAHRNGEAVSLKMESSKLISSSNDKRNDIAPGTKYLGPPNLPPNLRQEHSLTRGFQPYRTSDERRSTPPQMYNPSPPPTTMSGYPYHPSFTQSSRMPPQSYRLEESVYMERYGLLRPSTLPYPPPTNVIPHNRMPLYPANQYPPELIAQRSHPSNNSPYPSSNRYNHEEENSKEPNTMRKREIELYREHERYLEREEGEARERELEYLRKERTQMHQSPLTPHHSAARSDASADDKGFVGSITHGTPRDYVRSSSPPSSTSTTPLNLVTSAPHMENHLALKEEYTSRHGRLMSNAINGQIHQRNTSHQNSMSYRKENDLAPSYRMHYQENEAKPSFLLEKPDNTPPPHPKSIAYYSSENEPKKPESVETRTLSIASVINSQINGIFARDNIASNKGYFPPAFYNRAPDNLKSEKTLPAQDTYRNEKQPPIDSDKYPFLGSYKAKEEPPLSRLLMKPQSEGIVSYDSDRFEDHPPRLVSVLDARETKLKRLRKNSVGDESDESGIESEDEQDSRLRELLTITKGPPMKLEVDSKKTKFLSNFELVTHSKRQVLEIKKALRRQKCLRERSLSPLEESKSVKHSALEYDPDHLAELSNRLCFAENFQAKTEFLQKMKIVYLPPDKKSEKQRIQKIVIEERLRRNGILPPSQRCLELQGNIFRKRGCSILHGLKHAKRPNTAVNENSSSVPDSNGAFVKHSKTNGMSVQRLSTFLKPPMRTVNLPVPPLIPTHQAVSIAAETTPEKNALLVAKDTRPPQLNREFAKEFHNSVLQTTQMQLEKKNIPPVLPLELPIPNSNSFSSPEKSEYSPVEYKPLFRWPGIEAIMESYECHISEQGVERKYLLESCSKLKALNEESTIQAECLAQRREELLTEKKFLDSQQREMQARFENLKLLMQRFR